MKERKINMNKHITMEMWEEAISFDKIAVPGDTVDEEIVDEMLNSVPSLFCYSKYRQCGEPVEHCQIPYSKLCAPVYTTFKMRSDGKWVYIGNCFKGESIHRESPRPNEDDDKNTVYKTSFPIDILNNVFRNLGSDLKIFKRSEEKSECNMSSWASDNTTPHTVIAGRLLGINIVNWYWDTNSYWNHCDTDTVTECVVIEYTKGEVM